MGPVSPWPVFPRWVCASMNPGSAYMLLPSIILAPLMLGTVLWIAAIRSPSTTIVTGPLGGAPSPLINVTSVISSVLNGPSPRLRSGAGSGMAMPFLMARAAPSSPGIGDWVKAIGEATMTNKKIRALDITGRLSHCYSNCIGLT